MRVTSAEFIEGYDLLADCALREPVTITHDGHDRLVLLSAQEYARLRRHARRVFRTEELTDSEIARVAVAEVPAAHAHLDAELGDWPA